MLTTLRAVLIFFAVLFGADYLYRLVNNRVVRHFVETLEDGHSWLHRYAVLESAELIICAAVFAIAGAVLAAALPRLAHSVRLAFLLGVAYSAALFLFMPFLPLARYDHATWWLLALASSQYVIPGAAAAGGAALALRFGIHRHRRGKNVA